MSTQIRAEWSMTCDNGYCGTPDLTADTSPALTDAALRAGWTRGSEDLCPECAAIDGEATT